jgi:hypothetical protein
VQRWIEAQFESLHVEMQRLRADIRKLRQLIKKGDQSIMAEFSEYQSAVNETLMAAMALIVSESAEIQAAITAAGAGDTAAITAALTELTVKRQALLDGISGLVSVVPSPVEPSPVPTPETPLPSPEPPSAEEPTTPEDLVIVPSPEGVGIDGGFNIDVAE